MSISMIAGLGNPGPHYEGTRHNAGFLVVDALASRFGGEWKDERKAAPIQVCQVRIDGKTVHLLKPQDFMNHSGRVIGSWCRYFAQPTEELGVVYDDITLEPARLKISIGGSDGGHNGVADLMKHLDGEFVRYRVGIGPKTHPEMSLTDFVLGKTPAEELEMLRSRLPHLCEGLISLVKVGPTLTMNQFNQKRPPDERN